MARPESVMLQPYSPDLARALRESLGYTQQQMAEAVGLSRRDQWSRIEAGQAPGAQTWTLTLIVAGQHPLYGPRANSRRASGLRAA